MASKKPNARSKQRDEFLSGLGGMDDIFKAEESRQAQQKLDHEAALRRKACESKNRYASLSEAESTIIACEAHGTRGLHPYKCPYCNGWHITSKPLRK